MLKKLLNASSALYLIIGILSITEVGIAFALRSDTQKKLEETGTKVYFRISEVILPGLPATQLLVFICYIFSIFLHGYKRKKLFFAMNPENKRLAQQPATESDGGFIFFTIFRSFLITFFHLLAIFFTRKARVEYLKIDEVNETDETGDFIRRANAVFALNIVSLVLYYGMVGLDVVVHREERKLYKKLMYDRLQ